ncbi:hypothetical protein EYZ11_004368 [Aspergillus tanneri]|uniref:L-rhamnose mutarotase n=1 Tax=Aspergillus tanneri TaxID=1220188 RepID=A0A4S3JN31_9EURO|nr:hypothetical protein EYZ11_004368 [Aspergillus tanneri]
MPIPIKRIAQIVHLKPSAVSAYKECHANIWPEVLQQIKECNIVDWEDFEGDMQRMKGKS